MRNIQLKVKENADTQDVNALKLNQRDSSKVMNGIIKELKRTLISTNVSPSTHS